MAITWERIQPGFAFAKFLQGFKDTGSGVVRWRVRGLPVDSNGITTTSIPTILEGAGAAGLVPPPMFPAAGSTFSDELGNTIQNCVVLHKRLVKGPQLGRATIEVIYGPTPYLAFRGGPRIWGRSSAEAVPMLVPIYTQVGSPPWWRRQVPDLTVLRGKAMRSRPRVVALSTVDALANLIEPNVGRIYDLAYPGALPPLPPSIPFILGNYTFTEVPNSGASGEALLTYHFWSLAPVAAMPVNTFSGQSIALPALDYLQLYAIDDTVAPPVISAVRPTYLPGSLLP